MEDTETGKQDIFLRDKGDSIKSFLITDIGKLATRVINMKEAFPRFWSFTASLYAKQVIRHTVKANILLVILVLMV